MILSRKVKACQVFRYRQADPEQVLDRFRNLAVPVHTGKWDFLLGDIGAGKEAEAGLVDCVNRVGFKLSFTLRLLLQTLHSGSCFLSKLSGTASKNMPALSILAILKTLS